MDGGAVAGMGTAVLSDREFIAQINGAGAERENNFI